jgi:hypothetical protein
LKAALKALALSNKYVFFSLIHTIVMRDACIPTLFVKLHTRPPWMEEVR